MLDLQKARNIDNDSTKPKQVKKLPRYKKQSIDISFLENCLFFTFEGNLIAFNLLSSIDPNS